MKTMTKFYSMYMYPHVQNYTTNCAICNEYAFLMSVLMKTVMMMVIIMVMMVVMVMVIVIVMVMAIVKTRRGTVRSPDGMSRIS